SPARFRWTPPAVPVAIISPQTRPPPRSTRFPYTTLFRSVEDPDGAEPDQHQPVPASPGKAIQPGRNIGAYLRHIVPFSARYGGVDRKSTRLNSSHVKSSYAVFCLKKKKQDQPPVPAHAPV